MNHIRVKPETDKKLHLRSSAYRHLCMLDKFTALH